MFREANRVYDEAVKLACKSDAYSIIHIEQKYLGCENWQPIDEVIIL